MEATIKTAFQNADFKLKETVKVYQLSIMRPLPLAPAYTFIAERGIVNKLTRIHK